jgi:hypothetical protein
MSVTRASLSTIGQGLPKYRNFLAGNGAYVPPGFESIATATGTGSSGTITFSSIPQTYSSLQIRYFAKTSDSAAENTPDIRVRLNGDTGANYTRHALNSNDPPTASGQTGQTYAELFSAMYNNHSTYSNMGGVGVIDVHDYTSTSRNKTLRVFSGANANTTDISSRLFLTSSLWLNTSAVTSISFISSFGNFATSTQFALYGLKAAA